ncbi:putative ankyrin repeat-containing domain-containing protein [Helianthus annuus]|nr:putative ankyrin repeat-containing domain-containing protein [Helianthus annuus]
MMDKEDLELQNEGFNTALFVAAATGDINTVKLMVEKNRNLTTIPGDEGNIMPLYAAAFYGSFEVVKYLYENSNDLCDDGWNSENRVLLLQRCVEGDMFGTHFNWLVCGYYTFTYYSFIHHIMLKNVHEVEEVKNTIASAMNLFGSFFLLCLYN